jgi:hypothetical protein
MTTPAALATPLPVITDDERVHALTERYDPIRLERPQRSARRANNAVEDVFDLIGGVPRFAIWADNNPGEFYTKILPRTLQSQQQTEHSGEITIRTAVPRTAIDGEYTDVSSD